MSIYRNTVWIAKGLLEYTQGGYLSAAKNFTPSDLDVDCSSQHYMITGSNSGLGKQAALEIAKRGGSLHMVCRNAVAAEEAKQEIVAQTNNTKIKVHVLDLSRPSDVHKFAEKFKSEHTELNVLVNNAGCMVNTREVTEAGLEKNFATNTLGTYILTESLVPLLLTSNSPAAPARVITVSSGGMLTAKLDPTDLQTERATFDGTMVYAHNKRQQVVMVERWGAKYPGIRFTSMHPGWADTPAVRSAMPGFYQKMKDKLRSTEQGADTVVWLAVTENQDAARSGQFYQDRTVVSKHLPLAWSKSTQAEEDSLMDQLEELFKKFN